MTRIMAAAFDLEGTVVNLEPLHHQGHIDAARNIGLQLNLEECLREIPHFIGGPTEKIAEEISQLASVRLKIHVEPEKVLASTKSFYLQALDKAIIVPREGFNEFFQAIRRLGMKYAIGSLTPNSEASIILERSGIGKLFGYENIVLREHVKNLKPAPDVWIETAQRMGVEPASQVVFEDSPRGIKGAVKVGAYCIGMPVYNKPGVIMPLLEAGARRIFMEWDEINPQRLLENIYAERSK